MAARIQVPYLGEHYSDMLLVEAWIKNRTAASEAQSMICSALMKREATRDAIIERLAKKRGITAEELTSSILIGKATHLTPEEYAAVLQLDTDNSES